MGIVNSLIAEAEFANVRAQAQTSSELKQVPLQETELEPKQRPKSGPGRYGSYLSQRELEYWLEIEI